MSKAGDLIDQMKAEILVVVAKYVAAIVQAYIEEALQDLVGGDPKAIADLMAKAGR